MLGSIEYCSVDWWTLSWMYAACACCVGVLLVFTLLGTSRTVVRRGTIQRPVLVHLLPVSTIRPLYLTLQSIFVNVTSHPALHNVTTDIRDRDANPGMI